MRAAIETSAKTPAILSFFIRSARAANAIVTPAALLEQACDSRPVTFSIHQPSIVSQQKYPKGVTHLSPGQGRFPFSQTKLRPPPWVYAQKNIPLPALSRGEGRDRGFQRKRNRR